MLVDGRPILSASSTEVIFCVCQNRQWNNTHLYLTTHYTTITQATVLFQAGNDPVDLNMVTCSGEFVLAAVVSSRCQSGKYLLTPRIG